MAVGYTNFFWKDKWHGDQPLIVSFTDVLQLARQKDAPVKENYRIANGGLVWHIDFYKNAQD